MRVSRVQALNPKLSASLKDMVTIHELQGGLEVG